MTDTKAETKGQQLRLHGMIGLLAGLITNVIGICLMKRGNFGLTAFASVGLALYESTGVLTMGIWSWIFQASLLLAMMIVLRKAKWLYLASFAVVAAYSLLIDVGNLLLAGLPDALPWRLLYWVAGFGITCVGISFFMLCKMPVMAVDYFTREISDAKSIPFPKFKMAFDFSCLAFSAILSLVCTGRLAGAGVGTVVAVFLTGPVAGWFMGRQSRRIAYYV